MAELDEDLLRPLADQVDLVDVGHPQQPLADVLGAVLELGQREPVGGEHVERRIDIAVFVVEVGADDARRKVAADVANLLADLVPELLHARRRRLVDQRDADERRAGLRVSLDAIEIGELLQLLLDLVGDLQLDIARGRARPRHVDHHGLDGERGVLGASEIDVGVDAGGAQQDDHEQDERPVRDRPFRQVEAHEVTPVIGLLHLDGANPVSYTHLDVYKRQACASACTPPSGAPPNSNGCSGTPPIASRTGRFDRPPCAVE